jgi:hypothetical protein
MNERINELVLTARQQATSDTKDGSKQFDLDLFHKKFAELIVQECMKLNRDILCEDDPDYLDKIYKEHFGVE